MPPIKLPAEQLRALHDHAAHVDSYHGGRTRRLAHCTSNRERWENVYLSCNPEATSGWQGLMQRATGHAAQLQESASNRLRLIDLVAARRSEKYDREYKPVTGPVDTPERLRDWIGEQLKNVEFLKKEAARLGWDATPASDDPKQAEKARIYKDHFQRLVGGRTEEDGAYDEAYARAMTLALIAPALRPLVGEKLLSPVTGLKILHCLFDNLAEATRAGEREAVQGSPHDYAEASREVMESVGPMAKSPTEELVNERAGSCNANGEDITEEQINAKAAGSILDEDDPYITFSDARALTAKRPYELTRICDAVKVRSKGQGRGRLIHAADLARYMRRESSN